ncbi:MAG: glutamyl-tRNA reductase [bacterium]
MNLIAAGFSYKTTPLELREKLYFSLDDLARVLKLLVSGGLLSESVIISTCNRTEIYAVSAKEEEAVHHIAAVISSVKMMDCSILEKAMFNYFNYKTVKHLFSVAGGLDSLVVGETQILGQIKEGYYKCKDLSCTGLVMNKLFQQAIAVGKKVQNQTEIGKGAVSVSSTAVELAREFYSDISNHRVLIIGTGEMGILACHHLRERGVKEIFFTSRSTEKTCQIAEKMGGAAIPFAERYEGIRKCDIVISSTSAPEYVIGADQIKKIMKDRKNRRLLIIDIAVPRDVSPDVADIYNVFLYTIDELQHVVERNLQSRIKHVEKAKVIIKAEVELFCNWLSTIAIQPIIKRLHDKVDQVRTEELTHFAGRMDNETRALMEDITNRLVKKILHKPIVNLKALQNSKQGAELAQAINSLFDLEK